MIKCTVEMYGVSPEITDLRKVEVELNGGATLGDVVAALRRKVPALEGAVITKGEDRLTEYYAFAIDVNFQPDDSNIQLKDGDRVVLLLLATGG
jgi:molybdopterin converting factor small subunit